MIKRGNKLILGPEHFKYIFLLTLIINIKLSYNVFPKSHKCKSENKNPINPETLKETGIDASEPLALLPWSNPLGQSDYIPYLCFHVCICTDRQTHMHTCP